MRSPNDQSAVTLALGLVVPLLLGAAPTADEPRSTESGPVDASPDAAPSNAPVVALDQLLRLPNSFEADVDRRRGATASEWRSRFADVRAQIQEAKLQLARTQKELDQASDSSSAWQVSAPGSNDPQASPLSLRLRQDIRDRRAQVEETERRLRALEVEADLAAVPEAWRQ